MVCTSAAITMKKGEGKYEWNYDAGQCTFCGRCVDGCALKLLTMEPERPPVYETSGALKQTYRWTGKPPASAAPKLSVSTATPAAVEKRDVEEVPK